MEFIHGMSSNDPHFRFAPGLHGLRRFQLLHGFTKPTATLKGSSSYCLGTQCARCRWQISALGVSPIVYRPPLSVASNVNH